MPRVYIAGPMTGRPQFNFPAFDAARDAWLAKGWDVTSPADLDRVYWRETFGVEFDVNSPDPRIVAGGDIYETFLRMDVEALAKCNAIAVLPGWQTSKGTARELIVARVLKLEEYDAITGSPLITTTPATLPTDAAARKVVPMVRGLLDYFPAACAEVAHVSYIGNEQHNPGEPMHHARGKSTDHADCIVRHLVDRGHNDSDGIRHSAKVAWRALALLQEELERDGAPLPRGAKAPKED